ncbi:polysaccharide deacetylase family sporulation protein PdaB [Vulcanibacillus modesticaldus]|uniref:Polysaccharide deacetylase family sporulation protein PdaB n=1 Tax=Vulcanibacillus modesticaldus TaxID=337097 RepID=A0A1D2YS43_9BACI|nr:polysaccharide deacetylase family sporulation protein PdaB [Vulcanibacillus modesticaldus]OEF96455.1 polysaccharide deacetylase family sporulation protein PdaB [Vulcanibacillus modesticaldus]
MKYIWVLSAKKIKQTIIVLTALIFTIGIVYTEKENIPVFISSDGAKAIYSVNTDKKQIALTFDISWGNKRPDLILDILEENGMQGKVTFFLSSPWSKDHPEIVKRIVDGGYEIGSHGHKYVDYSKLTDQEIENQILKAHKILTELIGKEPNLIRTPNGDFDNRVLNIANRLGYTVIQWDTDSRDWVNPGVNEIINRVLKGVHPGDIILMHASDSSKQTQEALPIIIKKLKQEGYEFLTVSQLISNAKIESSEVE